MSPRARIWAAATVLLAVALAAVFAVAALRRPGEARVSLPGPPVAVEKTLSPRDPQFGDTVTARVDVSVDGRRVDPGSVRVQGVFAPYRVVSSTREVQRTGNVSVVRIEYRLRCLEPACAPGGERTTVRFGALRTVYAVGGRPAAVRSAWPVLRVHTRVTAGDLRQPFFRAGPARTSAAEYRLPPGAAGWTLLAVALALALGGAALIVYAGLRGRLRRRFARAEPLDAILRELAAASSNGDSSRRRRALEHLACELEPLDESLSEESRVLAWAPHDPQPEAIADLAGRVRSAVGR